MTAQFDLFASAPPAHDRSKLEAEYPDKNTRYLAYCAATGSPVASSENWTYQTWVTKKYDEFRALHKITEKFIPRYMATEFEAWLWGEGLA